MIILASGSPRRKNILKKIFPEFRVIKSCVDENKITAASPEEFSIKASYKKAEEVKRKIKYDEYLIISADTIVVLGNKKFGKPADKNDLIVILKSLMGREHRVITGITLLDSEGNSVSDFEESIVKIRVITEEELEDYAEKGNYLDKAGGYAIQDMSSYSESENAFDFVEYYKGSFTNIIGLPVEKLEELLKKIKNN